MQVIFRVDLRPRSVDVEERIDAKDNPGHVELLHGYMSVQY